MNRLRAVNSGRLAVAALIAAVVCIILLFWARDFIREAVVLPVSYLVWVASILLHATPQVFFWIALLLILLLIAVRSVSGKRKVYYPVRVSTPEGPGPTGRLLYWQSKVNLVRTGREGYYSTAFHTPLARLLTDLISYRYRLPMQQVEDRLRENTLDVPPEVREYILTSFRPYELTYRGFFDQLWKDLLEVVKQGLVRLGLRQPAPADPRIAVILKFMEEELEVPHGNTGK